MPKNKPISLYWKCQLMGWTTASLYWMFQGYTTGRFLWGMAVIQLLSDLVVYIAITHLYRAFARLNNWQQLSLNRLIWRIVIAVPLMAILYLLVTLIKLYAVRWLFQTHQQQSFSGFFEDNALGIYVAGLRLMAIWLLAYHLYHYAKREINLASENAKLALSVKQAQLDNLSSQLNPHFLFNALNTIKSLIFTNPNSAARAIDLMSELLRSGLYSGDVVEIPLADEIDLVKDYLELEKLRLQERLSYRFEIDPSLAPILVPRMSVQTLVENAVKYGIANQKHGGELIIYGIKEKDFNCLRVVNTGKLGKNVNQFGVGLKNLKSRLKMVYHEQASFSLYEYEEKVCAEIKIPVR
ncbi:histidine kinase [Pedobacter sp. Du54]|uniref:sensor histidine kinase n=1 Tax=Pedobacter anseongensis TaxID=3133439 RepID=UPI0030A73297